MDNQHLSITNDLHGANVLLAPNGKPSNLTPEQYFLVRTPEFKEWFGDWERLAMAKVKDPAMDEITLQNLSKNVSKVVDENGEPLVVYHGSKSEKDFNVFNDSSFIYFGKKKSYVEKHFAKNLIDKPFRLKSYFLNIKNPINAEHFDFVARPYEEIQELLSGVFNIDNDVEEVTQYKNEYIRFWEVLRFSKKLFPAMKQKKVYDGISLYENWNDNTTWEKIDDWTISYVVLNPNQIKLADGSNTTFDGSNPDIRYAHGGLIAPNGKKSNLTPEQYKLVRTPEFKAWFGDWENDPENASKVVDQNGEPLVVYHGTNASFTIFDTDEESQNRKGGIWDAEYPDGYIFMTSNKNVAKNYGQKVIPLFVNLVYPVTKKVKKGSSLVLPFDDEGLAFEGDAIVTDGIDYIVGTQDEYQVKLADGTNTTFDSSNPDIRFDGGGEVKNLEENYLKITSIKDKSIIKGSLDGFYINANFGRDGSIAWEIPYSQIEEGKKDNPNYIIVQSIDRNKNLAYKGNEDSKGEGTKAIASLFNKYPSLQVIGYDDWAESGFWQKIGGSVDELHRQDFFNYFENKFGYNPDIRYAKGGYVPISQFNRNINNELKNYIDEDEEVSFEYKRERVKLVYALKFYEKNNITPLAEPDLASDSFLWQYVAYNDSDYRIMFHFNFEVGSIKLEKVEATLYSEDWNDEIKTFAKGGEVQNDLDAYEEAMGESFFDNGGKAPIKKVYVSIRLRYDIEKVDWEYYYKYKENPFLELMSGTLDGIKGVSSSSNNIAEWFTTRDALIVMNYQDFANINNIQVIDYENIDELMANDLFIFRRLYNNLNEYDESESQLSRVIIDSLRKIGKNISGELNLLLEVVDKQKAKEVYRIERFLNPSETSAFWKWIESNQIKIDSAISFTKAIIDFNKIDDNYLGYGFPNPTITIEDLLPSVENGIRYSSKIYESEQEIIMLDRKLNIPKGSQLFFKNQTSESNRNDLIKSYKLDNRYKIYFVDNEDLERFRIKWMEKQEQVFKDRMYKGMMDLEEKKSEVLQDLLQKFLDNTYSQIEKIVEKDMLEYAQSKTFLNYDRDMEYQWYELPPIKKVLAEYDKIVRQEWEILESNKVKDLDLYKFASFQDQANQRIKEYLKENEQEIEEELYNYKTATNYYISLGLFKYDLVKSLYDYENLPQWFSYKDLSEMYLQKMGVDIYRYYDKKELKLVSQYEVGGEIN